MHSAPKHTLPLHPEWLSTEDYVDSLLSFATKTDLFRNLCGGVHVLDFLTREPDLYSWVLPQEWREWCELVDIHDFLDFLFREDLSCFPNEHITETADTIRKWRAYPLPPSSLVQYIHSVRIHCLARQFHPVSPDIEPVPQHVSVGMKPKKIHEVQNFAAYVDQLSSSLSDLSSIPLSVIDFGSGQNYLGRTLMCPPYNKHVIAIEQRHHNVEGAKGMDVHAKLAKKKKVMRNKKEWKRRLGWMHGADEPLTPPSETLDDVTVETAAIESETATPIVVNVSEVPDAVDKLNPSNGSMTYIEQSLESGHLEEILARKCLPQSASDPVDNPKSLVVSIHSCGNLTHHGLRSIILNESVQAVAMIGCCYNLLTERLGPATYKHPQLRPNHPRLEATGSTYDPHGFPMSTRLEAYEYDMNTADGTHHHDRGVRLNITARMMAVQAPYNWGREDSEAFFTRHFYRALLQRVLLDRGVVKQATSADHVQIAGGSLSGKDHAGTPLIIGSLPKSAFTSFEAYVNAALRKLTVGNHNVEEGKVIAEMTADILADVTVLKQYEERYGSGRKHLAVIWSLMAFSAGVVESLIVVDRWLWLTEQPEVKEAWVETVFDYAQSPRNLCVVGIKK